MLLEKNVTHHGQAKGEILFAHICNYCFSFLILWAYGCIKIIYTQYVALSAFSYYTLAVICSRQIVEIRIFVITETCDMCSRHLNALWCFVIIGVSVKSAVILCSGLLTQKTFLVQSKLIHGKAYLV